MYAQTAKDLPRVWSTVHRYLVVNHVLLLEQAPGRTRHESTIYRVTTHPRGNRSAWVCIGNVNADRAVAADVFNVAADVFNAALATLEAVDR